jgi:hypothetical protein
MTIDVRGVLRLLLLPPTALGSALGREGLASENRRFSAPKSALSESVNFRARWHTGVHRRGPRSGSVEGQAMLGESLPTDSLTRKVRAARGPTSHPIELGSAPVSSSSRYAITGGNEVGPGKVPGSRVGLSVISNRNLAWNRTRLVMILCWTSSNCSGVKAASRSACSSSCFRQAARKPIERDLRGLQVARTVSP